MLLGFLTVTGRPHGQKDPVHSLTRKLESIVRKHLSSKSKKSVSHVRSIVNHGKLLAADACSVDECSADVVCLIFVGAVAEGACTSLLMESDDLEEEVNVEEFIADVRQKSPGSTILSLTHFTDGTGSPVLNKRQAEMLATSHKSAGATAAIVGFTQPMSPKDSPPAEIILDQCIHKIESAFSTGFVLSGEWPNDKRHWRAPSPPGQADPEMDAFRASTKNDRPVSQPQAVVDNERVMGMGSNFESVLFPNIASKSIGPTVPETLSKAERSAVLGALGATGFELALDMYKYGVVTVKSVQVVAAEKTPPRLLQSNEFWCSACESVVSGRPNWEKHLVSNPHMKRVEQGVIATYTCIPCNTDICGEINLNQHLQGVKHKRKADFYSFTCPTCKNNFTGQPEFIQHRKSACPLKDFC